MDPAWLVGFAFSNSDLKLAVIRVINVVLYDLAHVALQEDRQTLSGTISQALKVPQ